MRTGQGGSLLTGNLTVRARFSFAHATIAAGLCGMLAACSTSTTAQHGLSDAQALAASESVADPAGRYHVGKPYQVGGKWYKPQVDPSYEEVGTASWYGGQFHGRRTANGEVFDMAALTAAHPTLPLPSYVRVTNLSNERSVIVRVNDRGPFSHSRLIDVSARTAEMLDFKRAGMAKVRVEYVEPARIDGNDESFLLASYKAPDARPAARADVMLASAETPRRPAVRHRAPSASVMLASAEPRSRGADRPTADAPVAVAMADPKPVAARPTRRARAAVAPAAPEKEAAQPVEPNVAQPVEPSAPVMVASAQPSAPAAVEARAPEPRPAPPPAAAAPAATAPEPAEPSLVAFVAQPAEATASDFGALEAASTVSASYDADARIAMAFQSVSGFGQ